VRRIEAGVAIIGGSWVGSVLGRIGFLAQVCRHFTDEVTGARTCD